MASYSQLRLQQLTGSIMDLAYSGSQSSATPATAAQYDLNDLGAVLGEFAGAIGRISGKNGVGANAFTNQAAGVLASAGDYTIDAATTIKLDSAAGDISFEDDGTAKLAIDMDGTASEIIMQLKVDSDDFVFKQFDGTEVFRVEDNGDFDVAGGAGSSGVTITAAGQLTADGRVIVDDATEATSTTDGSIQTDGGLSVAKSVVIGDDLDLLSDGAILNIGNSSKFTLTAADANNAVVVTANHRLALGNAGEYIAGDGTDMKIVSSGDVDVTATLVDVTGALTTSGRVQVDDATEATSATDGSLQTDGGLSVVKSAVIGDDLDLLSDGAILSIGSTSKFALTDQAANNTVMASAGHRLAFGDAGEYISGDGTDLDIVSSGDLDITATLVDVTGALTTSGRVQVDDATEATSTTDGSLQTDGGLSVAKSAVIGDDLDLLSNSAIFKVGSDQPFTLTHANANNTLLASANHRLAFGDAGEYIYGDGTNLILASSGILSASSVQDFKVDAGANVELDAHGARFLFNSQDSPKFEIDVATVGEAKFKDASGQEVFHLNDAANSLRMPSDGGAGSRQIEFLDGNVFLKAPSANSIDISAASGNATLIANGVQLSGSLGVGISGSLAISADGGMTSAPMTQAGKMLFANYAEFATFRAKDQFSAATTVIGALNILADAAGGGVVGAKRLTAQTLANADFSLSSMSSNAGFTAQIDSTSVEPSNTEVYVNGQLLLSASSASGADVSGGDYVVKSYADPGVLKFAFDLEVDDVVLVKTTAAQ